VSCHSLITCRMPPAEYLSFLLAITGKSWATPTVEISCKSCLLPRRSAHPHALEQQRFGYPTKLDTRRRRGQEPSTPQLSTFWEESIVRSNRGFLNVGSTSAISSQRAGRWKTRNGDFHSIFNTKRASPKCTLIAFMSKYISRPESLSEGSFHVVACLPLIPLLQW